MRTTMEPALAERVGFEPTNTREDVTGIPVQRLRPLGHLSVTRLRARLGARRNRGMIPDQVLGTRLPPEAPGTTNGGGSSRHGPRRLRGGGAGSFRAGILSAACVSGASMPGGNLSGGAL